MYRAAISLVYDEKGLVCYFLACVAGGIVGARNKILAAEPLIYIYISKSSSPFSSRLRRLLLATPLSKRYSARLQYRQLRRLVTSSFNDVLVNAEPQKQLNSQEKTRGFSSLVNGKFDFGKALQNHTDSYPVAARVKLDC